MLGVISTRVKIILYIIIGTLVFVLALATFIHFALGGHPKEDTPIQDNSQPTVKVEMKEQNKRTIHYVPKAIGEDTDIQIEDKQKPIVVTVNGKRHEVQTTKVKESHKFDNGKLVVSEERQVNLDIKVPEQPRFKKGVYVETDTNKDKAVKMGARLSYQTKELDIDLKADILSLQKNTDKRITLTATKWL